MQCWSQIWVPVRDGAVFAEDVKVVPGHCNRHARVEQRAESLKGLIYVLCQYSSQYHIEISEYSNYLLRNKALSLDVDSHMMNFNQSECSGVVCTEISLLDWLHVST